LVGGVQQNVRLLGTTRSGGTHPDFAAPDARKRTTKLVCEISVPNASTGVGFRGTNAPTHTHGGDTDMLIGYARVSTTDQHLSLQTDALHAAGCEQLYTDTVSGATVDRPGLTAALSTCRSGDTLVVWKLDRLGRSLPHLVETVRDLVARGVGFRSLQESIDTTTSGGKLIFHIFASLAEFERDLIRERTNAGLSAARARGRNGGRPKGVDTKKQKAAVALKKEGTHSVREICAIVGIARNTYYKYTRAENQLLPSKRRTNAPNEHQPTQVT
jgi:DNA invertase Pin-like site-specific DNA recombinase